MYLLECRYVPKKLKITIVENGDCFHAVISILQRLNDNRNVDWYFEYELVNESINQYQFLGFDIVAGKDMTMQDRCWFADFNEGILEDPKRTPELEEINYHILQQNMPIFGKIQKTVNREKVPTLICKVGGYNTKIDVIK
ncbi:MAG: hypothetical protein AB7V50_10130 [Vampirovibrionia bacterium]